MKIRDAVYEDIEWIVDYLGKDMLSLYGIGNFCNIPYLKREFVPNLIDNHVCLVAEEERPVGCIAGMIVPAPYNPELVVLSELFWWVDEEKRNGLVGARLLHAFDKVGRDIGVDYLSMSLMPSSGVNTDALIKRGYRLTEYALIKGVK